MELKDQIIKGDILKLNILKTNALHELFKKRENKFLFFSFFGFIHFFFLSHQHDTYFMLSHRNIRIRKMFS